MDKLLALIPARGGSKRLPGKNIRPLGGLPLIAYSIQTAQESACFDRIIVSTDDPAIAAVASNYGAEVPWLRSPQASRDESSSLEVVLEVLATLEANGNALPTAVMLLQPTSPFRSVASIRRALEIFQSTGGESVISVSPATDHPWWCKRLSDHGEIHPFVPDAPTGLRSQDLPAAYALDGLIFLASVTTLRTTHSFYSTHSRALVIESPEESIDIDTPFDWLIAETIYRERAKASL